MAPQISRAGTVRTWRMGTSIVVIVIVGRRRIVVRIRRRIGIRVHIGIVVVAVIAVIRIGVTGPAEADPIAEAAISPAPMTAITAEPASKMASAEMAAAKTGATAKVAASMAAAEAAMSPASMALGQGRPRQHEQGRGDEDQTKNACRPHGDLPPWGLVVNARAWFPLPTKRKTILSQACHPCNQRPTLIGPC